MDLAKYYAEICKKPILRREEEDHLFAEYYDENTSDEDKKRIRSLIIESNLRFVFKEAKEKSIRHPEMFGDLISAGNEGLIVGFEKYRPGGVKYLTYAGWWVKQRMYKEMSKMRIVSLPIWKQQLSTRIERALENKENITLDELVSQFEVEGIAKKDIEELYKTRYLTYYIDDLKEEEFEIDPIGTEVQRRLDDEKTWKTVAGLPSPHREVIAKIYGLEDGEEHSVTRIAKALRLPKKDIARIKTEALSMLRELMKKDL